MEQCRGAKYKTHYFCVLPCVLNYIWKISEYYINLFLIILISQCTVFLRIWVGSVVSCFRCLCVYGWNLLTVSTMAQSSHMQQTFQITVSHSLTIMGKYHRGNKISRCVLFISLWFPVSCVVIIMVFCDVTPSDLVNVAYLPNYIQEDHNLMLLITIIFYVTLLCLPTFTHIRLLFRVNGLSWNLTNTGCPACSYSCVSPTITGMWHGSVLTERDHTSFLHFSLFRLHKWRTINTHVKNKFTFLVCI